MTRVPTVVSQIFPPNGKQFLAFIPEVAPGETVTIQQTGTGKVIGTYTNKDSEPHFPSFQIGPNEGKFLEVVKP